MYPNDTVRALFLWIRVYVTIGIICLGAMIVCDQYGEDEEFEFVPVGPTIAATR